MYLVTLIISILTMIVNAIVMEEKCMEVDGNEHRNDGMSCRKSELINIERRVAAFSMVI